jgi:hypothetical protein
MNSKSEQNTNIKPQYFKDWISYSIPEKPDGPLPFVETKSLDSFCMAYFGELGRLARFVKYLVRRHPLGNLPLGKTRPPGSLIFFPVCELKEIPSTQDISYASTEGKDSYFEGRVGLVGDAVALVKVTRELFFDDNWAYWPNGKPRERHLINGHSTAKTTKYDQKGEPIR